MVLGGAGGNDAVNGLTGDHFQRRSHRYSHSSCKRRRSLQARVCLNVLFWDDGAGPILVGLKYGLMNPYHSPRLSWNFL
jgi:hypothetical protein